MFKDGAVVRAQFPRAVYVIFGGAKFWIPSPDVLEQHYGGWDAVELVPGEALAAVASIPRDGTVLREFSAATVYVVQAASGAGSRARTCSNCTGGGPRFMWCRTGRWPPFLERTGHW